MDRNRYTLHSELAGQCQVERRTRNGTIVNSNDCGVRMPL
jgi:hypothetical protein